MRPVSEEYSIRDKSIPHNKDSSKSLWVGEMEEYMSEKAPKQTDPLQVCYCDVIVCSICIALKGSFE